VKHPLYFPSWLHPQVIPGLPVRWYGVMYILAFITAFFLYKKQIRERRYPMSQDELMSLFGWGILGLILGARIFYCLVYETTGLYRRAPWLIFWPFQDGRFTGLAGMSYHGGVIGAFLGVSLCCIIRRFDFREIIDMCCASIPLGYTFGRLGNFINGELYGRATASFLGMVFPDAEQFSAKLPQAAAIAQAAGVRAVNGFLNLPRYPSQLFEAFFEGIVLWTIVWALRKHKPFKGFLAGLYIFGYGFIRFFLEYFREPDANLGYRLQFGQVVPMSDIAFSHPALSFSTGQLLCTGMMLLALIWWLVAAHLPDRRPVMLYPDAAASERLAGQEKEAARRKARSFRKKLK
jgi:phosphatidylglycerol:prolipoprotein diacylglycerol transferase